MTPFAQIKASGGCWDYVIQFVDLYPERQFMLSMASDALGGETPDELKYKSDGKTLKPEYSALKELLEKENVIILAACFNYETTLHSTLNENEQEQEYGEYKSASVNSEKNNMIAVVGYNPA